MPDSRLVVELENGCRGLTGQVPAPQQLEQMTAYLELLRQWNQIYNLTAVRDPADMVSRHVLDSLAVLPWLPEQARLSLLDAGTGGGLPGIPLGIMRPSMSVTLLDSVGKKVRFLRHVKRTLGLNNIYPVQARLEQFALEHATTRPFAGIISRAFSELAPFAHACRPLMDPKTRLYAMKGRLPDQEVEALPAWIRVEKIEKLSVPGLHEQRHLVIMSLFA